VKPVAANQGHGIIVTNDVSLLLSDYLGYSQRPCAVHGGGGGDGGRGGGGTDATCRCDTLCKTPLKKVHLILFFWAFAPN
jgi:hypothetical protein